MLIENSVTRVTVRHHSCDAEQLPEWRNFQFTLKNHYGFFFLHTLPLTITFRLEYVLFHQFYAKITTFFIKKSLVRLLSYMVTLKRLRRNWHKNDVKTLKSSYWYHVRESSYTPHLRHYLAPGMQENISSTLSVSQKFPSGMHENIVFSIDIFNFW